MNDKVGVKKSKRQIFRDGWSMIIQEYAILNYFGIIYDSAKA
jgi:hypothetical protein